MAITAAEILVRVAADTDPLTRGLAQAQNQTQQFAQRLSSFGRSVSQAGTRLTVGLTLPIVGFGVKSVAAFEEAAAAARQTNAVLESTGNAANITRKGFDELTKSVARNAAVDDDLIRQGANMLLTFKKIRNQAGANNDIFDQSVSLMADFAAGMAAVSGGTMDMRSASIMLGKALNDPVKGVTALTRAGVQFTEAQKDQIETLVKSGRQVEAQKMIISELESQFGGSAKANATASMRLKQALDDLAESIGKEIYPLVKDFSRAIVGIVESFKALTPETRKTVLQILAFSAALGPVLKMVGPLLSVAGAFARIAGSARKAAAATGAINVATGAAGAAAGGAAAGGAVASKVPVVGAILLTLAAAALYWKKRQDDAANRTAELVKQIRRGRGSMADFADSVDAATLLSGQLNRAQDAYTGEQGRFIQRAAFVNDAMAELATGILENNRLTTRQSERIAFLIGGLDAMGVQADALVLKQASNLIAMGDVTGALRLLKEAARAARDGLSGLAGALEDPRAALPNRGNILGNTTTSSSPTTVKFEGSIILDRKVFLRSQDVMLRASGY